MNTKTILIADDQSLFRQSAADSLRARFRGVQVLEAEDGAAALEILERSQVDVLVTDLRMPEADGLDLVAWIASHRVPIQVIVATAHANENTRKALDELGVLVCLDKPIDLSTLHDTVDRMLHLPRARLSGVTLPGFVQLLEAEKRTCALRVKSEDGAGTLVFDRGVIVDAWSRGLEGDDAALAILSLRDCTLDLVGSMPAQSRRVTHPLSFLLLESARLVDEAEKEAKVKARADLLAESMRALMEIDGALGAALVDCTSGDILAYAEAGPNVDARVAATGHVDMVNAARRVIAAARAGNEIEEILITLERHYELIRPIEQAGVSLLVYVIADRGSGNLALGRHQIAKMVSELPFESRQAAPPLVGFSEW